MLHADARPVPVLGTRRALNRSLLLHLLVLGVVAGLPYLHQPPKVVEPPAIQAMLIEKAVVQHDLPRPVKPVEPVPPPPAPEPERIELPEPVVEPPKIALPKPPKPEKPVEKVVEKKPEITRPLIKKPILNRNALDEEMKAMQKELQQADRQAELNRIKQEMDKQAIAMKVSANQAQVASTISKIRARVENRWNRPLSAKAGMSTLLRISLLPGGEVANVIVATSSGNAAFDASAVDAVHRASPLPVPDDVGVFSQSFRNFTLKFSPEDL